jgi:hypothetical protein
MAGSVLHAMFIGIRSNARVTAARYRAGLRLDPAVSYWPTAPSIRSRSRSA